MKKSLIVIPIIIGVIVVYLVSIGSEPEYYEPIDSTPQGITIEQYDQILMTFHECMSNKSKESSFDWGGKIGIVQSGGSKHCYEQRNSMIEEFRNDNQP